MCLRVADGDAAAAAATRAAGSAVGRPLLVPMLRLLPPLPAVPLLLPPASPEPRGFERERRPYPPPDDEDDDGRGGAATRLDREILEAAARGKPDDPAVFPGVCERRDE